MNIEMYGVQAPDSDECDPLYEAAEYQDAKQRAAECNGKVICFEFEFSDSYVVDDFTKRPARREGE